MRLSNLQINNVNISDKKIPPLWPLNWKLKTNTGSPNNGILQKVQYVNGTYIFGTYYESPRHYTSTDLETFNYTSDSNYVWQAATMGNYVYELRETVLTRTLDGITYEIMHTNSSTMRDIIYIPTIGLIIVAQNGIILKSVDGINFNIIPSGTTASLLAVCFVSGVISILTNDYTVLYSVDGGETYNTRSIAPNMGNMPYISSGTSAISSQILGSSNPPYILRTTDGSSFNRVNIPHIGIGSVQGISYGNGRYVVASRVPASSSVKLFESLDDGSSFQEIECPFETSSNFPTISFSNGVFFLSDMGTGDLWVS